MIANNVIDGAETEFPSPISTKAGDLPPYTATSCATGDAACQPAAGNAGVGIGVEADTVVTGNIIEDAPRPGITAGWGQYLRNVAVTGNVVRDGGIGVAVSVATGAGVAVISGNLFAGTTRGAIVGMEWHKAVSGDLALSGAERYPQLKISSNQVS